MKPAHFNLSLCSKYSSYEMKSAVLLRRVRRVIPFIVLSMLAYIDYASCYIVAWKEVYHLHSATAAIVYWVLLALFQATHLFYWALIFIRGTGKIPQFQHFDLYGTKSETNAPVPEVFVCDEQGFPFWCSKCQNLKPDRSFHSSDLDICVPRFDHFCLWIGTAIGRENFLPFVKFLQSFSAYSIISLCFVAVYGRSALHHNRFNLHFVALFIMNACIIMMTMALLIGTAKNTFTNSTSFDEITRRQAQSHNRWLQKQANMNPKYTWCAGRMPRVESGIRYVNMAHDDTRKVVSFNVRDNPYSNGFRVNLINTCLNGNYNLNSTTKNAGNSTFLWASFVLIVPFAEFLVTVPARKDDLGEFQKNSDEMSPSFISKILDKIEKNQFQYAQYLSPRNDMDTPKE
ncbi:hypothetical protein JCM33374_g5718 [Metschnikowia sp. JCM 33374]|nr:hypothetical protein JCM33374_g5718 [Metschnikowia sp. JCM 33374]